MFLKMFKFCSLPLSWFKLGAGRIRAGGFTLLGFLWVPPVVTSLDAESPSPVAAYYYKLKLALLLGALMEVVGVERP